MKYDRIPYLVAFQNDSGIRDVYGGLAEIVGRAFIYVSLLYPIGYAVAGVIYFAWSRPIGAAVATGHLAACVALLAAWWMASDAL